MKTANVLLLMTSMLFLAWVPKRINCPIKAEKKISSSLKVNNTEALINNGNVIPFDKIKDFTKATFTMNYTKLKLTKDQYNSLASKGQFKQASVAEEKKEGGSQKNRGIVFQFNYASQAYFYPTLRAYPMQFKHQQVTFGTPLNLEYADVKPLPDLSVCMEQVTGDIQITLSDIEQLKAESNPKDAEKYEYLLFTPKYDDTNQHVYFEITVFPSTSPDLTPKSIKANPSPPYSKI